MDPNKKMVTLGIVFLACGVTFLAVAFTTHLAPLYAVGLVEFALGIVFMVLAKTRAKRALASSDN